MGLKMRYIDQVDIRGRRVLLRVDYNVPLAPGGGVADDWRIRATLPTVRHALGAGSKLVIASHLGRPGGKVVPELSLAPVGERLSQLLGEEVTFAGDVAGERAREAVARAPPGSAIMLENLRFDPGEEANSDGLAEGLGALADVYVDDAFGNAHRAHASNVGVTRFAAESAGGLLMRRELQAIERGLEAPERPLAVVLGGAKAASKIGVVERLLRRADVIMIGGAMAFPFLRAAGLETGTSEVPEEVVERASGIMRKAAEVGARVLLPADLVVTGPGEATGTAVPVGGVGAETTAVDVGPQTIEGFVSELEGAGTVIWNGPMGVFEREPFGAGTRAVGEAIARGSAFSLVGGGDTVTALRRYGLSERVSYLSTGGGAFLVALSGGELPAVRALEQAAAVVAGPSVGQTSR